MSELEKAAIAALEALKDFDYDKRMNAITALRQALTEQSSGTEQPAESPEPPHCMVGGLIKANTMCGHVIQMKFCGYGGPCQYKGNQK